MTEQINGLYPWYGHGRYWAGPGGWVYDIPWWSFDVGRDGVIVTLMMSKDYNKSPYEYTYYTIRNCTNQTVASRTRTFTATYRYYLLKVYPSGQMVAGSPISSVEDTTVYTRKFKPPSEPPEPRACGQGNLIYSSTEGNGGGINLAHVDIMPDGTLVLLKEHNTHSNKSTMQWLGDAWRYDTTYQRGKNWIGNGHALATESHIGFYFQVIRYNQVVDWGADFTGTGFNFYDLQYDGYGVPWATMVQNDHHSDDTSIVTNDTRFLIGNQTHNALLFTSSAPLWYASGAEEFGPPINTADITVNPYGSGAITAMEVNTISPPSWPQEEWYKTQPPRSDYVHYIDGNGVSIDLYSVDPAELEDVTEFQFLP